ncbi:hypothetical protein ABIB50_004847 [Mucilaginibacter sp. UYCu711]
MTRKCLITIIIAAIFLSGCNKVKPVSLIGENFYLVSTDINQSRYVQINYQFQPGQVEVFAIKSLHPMYGDVTIGPYSFKNNMLKIPLIGTIVARQTADGFNLYRNGKLKYRLTRETKSFIQPPQHQSQFVSITK